MVPPKAGNALSRSRAATADQMPFDALADDDGSYLFLLFPLPSQQGRDLTLLETLTTQGSNRSSKKGGGAREGPPPIAIGEREEQAGVILFAKTDRASLTLSARLRGVSEELP